MIQRINKAYPDRPPWGIGDGLIDPGKGRLLSLVDRWQRDPNFRAAQNAARAVNQQDLDPPVAMMGYDNRPMSLEYARRCLPLNLYERWHKGIPGRLHTPTELHFMDFVAQWDRVLRSQGSAPAKSPNFPKRAQRPAAASSSTTATSSATPTATYTPDVRRSASSTTPLSSTTSAHSTAAAAHHTDITPNPPTAPLADTRTAPALDDTTSEHPQRYPQQLAPSPRRARLTPRRDTTEPPRTEVLTVASSFPAAPPSSHTAAMHH